jgi:hypothetical protein
MGLVSSDPPIIDPATNHRSCQDLTPAILAKKSPHVRISNCVLKQSPESVKMLVQWIMDNSCGNLIHRTWNRFETYHKTQYTWIKPRYVTPKN